MRECDSVAPQSAIRNEHVPILTHEPFQSFCYFVRSRMLIFQSRVLTEWRLVAHSLQIMFQQTVKRMISRGEGRVVSEAFEAWSNSIYLKS